MATREQFPNEQGYSHHNKPRLNHKQGASYYNKNKLTDNYAKICESGNHTLLDQVGAGMYKNGHTKDPVREELTHLQDIATKWEQQHPDNK